MHGTACKTSWAWLLIIIVNISLISSQVHIPCPFVPIPENGFYVESRENDVVVAILFFCNNGYLQIGSIAIDCLSNGTWNGEPPVCQPLDCGTLKHPANGGVDLSNGTTFGNTAVYSCDIGYRVDGSAIRECNENGVWSGSETVCTINDCGPLSAPSNGHVDTANGTTFGQTATYTCNEGFRLVGESSRTCDVVGGIPFWIGQIPLCYSEDCGPLSAPSNGHVDTVNGTTFGQTATYTCNDGFDLVGEPSRTCDVIDGTPIWNGTIPTCESRDCGQLSNPTNGRVSTPDGTVVGSSATYACDNGYILNGTFLRTCGKTEGRARWTDAPPLCEIKEEKILYCPTSTDARGAIWQEVSAGTTSQQKCSIDFTGHVTRKCNIDGTWLSAKYNCIRSSVSDVNNDVNALSENSTTEELTTLVQTLTNVTSNVNNTSDLLTDAELTSLSDSLKTVSNFLLESDEVVSDEITEGVVKTVSNLVDVSNSETWTSVVEVNNNAGDTVLSAVDTITQVLKKQLNTSSASEKTVVKDNIAIDVRKINNTGVIFPRRDQGGAAVNQSDETTAWIYETKSEIRLNKEAFGDDVDKTEYTTSNVMYRDMSAILPGSNPSTGSSESSQERLNGPVLALSVYPHLTGVLDPPIQITFEHYEQNRTKPACSFWKFRNGTRAGRWSTEGCVVASTDKNVTVCNCNHLTNFAVLMSPFIEVDADSVAIRILSIIGIGLSILGLIPTIVVHLLLWRHVKSDRTILLMNLCVALLTAYIVFLAGVERTESKGFCAVVAAMLHYIYLAVFCLMLAEGVELALTVLIVFPGKSRVRKLIIAAWLSPAIIIGISLAATQAEGYGTENFCWLSIERGLIWAFVGPALLIITLNIVCLGVMFRGMFKMQSMKNKNAKEKISTGFRSLCVLLPLMGVSWILGVFYVDESMYFIQFLFPIFNALQGFFIFLFHCVFNQQIQNAIRLRQRRRSSQSWYSTKSTSKDESGRRKSSTRERAERLNSASTEHTVIGNSSPKENTEIHKSKKRHEESKRNNKSSSSDMPTTET